MYTVYNTKKKTHFELRRRVENFGIRVGLTYADFLAYPASRGGLLVRLVSKFSIECTECISEYKV